MKKKTKKKPITWDSIDKAMNKLSLKEAKRMTTDLAINPETGIMTVKISKEVAGAGGEQLTAADRAVTWFKLLQGGNPEIKTARSRVKGATPGMFYNTGSGALYDGEKGVDILICTTERFFVEWASEDNGGGFVGKHDPESVVVRDATRHSKEIDVWPIQRSNGNELTDTRYLYILAGESLEPAIFAVKSKFLKTYRDFMARYHNWRVDSGDGVLVQPALPQVRIKFTSFDDAASGFDFSNLIMEPAVGNDMNQSFVDENDERVQIALKVIEDFKASKIKVDYAGERKAADTEDRGDTTVIDNDGKETAF